MEIAHSPPWSHFSPIPDPLDALEKFLGISYLGNGPALAAPRTSCAASDLEAGSL